MDSQEKYFKELAAGTRLYNGKYVIERVIGMGGFGITYYAKHTSLNQYYAIKEFFVNGYCVRDTQHFTVNLQGMKPEMYEKYRQKFVEEAQIIVKLNHPNIVKVLDIFEENNTSYIVMPFIDGQTLQSLVERQGPLNYEQTVNYLGQIASAVGYIHSKNILHRDIKPENIIITPDYHAILIDFGSAREFVQDKTQAHTAILTKCYAPPEQYNTISHKGSYTDIYSLGAVYYFTTTGKAPIEATTRHIEKMPEPKALNPKLTDDVNRTILKAMAMKPENRHQTIDEFLDDLFGQRPSEPIEDDNVIIIEKSRKWLWITLVAVLVAGGIIIGSVLNNNIQKEKQIALQNTIMEQTKVVRDSISLENVYWDATGIDYHLFHNCSKLSNDNIHEGAVEQAFMSNKTHLCQECINKVTEYKNYRKNVRDFYNAAVDLQDKEYFKNALDYCNKVLEMRPDDTRMKDRKQEIESRR